MHIPLDYYRILGLPIQATAEQLRQAHRDRTLQLPRREYSDAAITSRKQLLDEAYAVLSVAEERQSYDASFLAKTYELTPDANPAALDADPLRLHPSQTSSSDSHTPSIEIREDQLVGALLILQELGEYELVLRLGRPFLKGGSASLKEGKYGDPRIVFADIVLTVALACLELGREQWQQGQYENAAEALDTGQQLLLREGLFVGVRGEIQADLNKLRPYRVLELLALPESYTAERLKGLQLLQDMLKERGGIDGDGDDQSGLNIDDFLRFIQQLRGYLTAAEQQILFEEEARRPSAVATYLAVYALLARGFAEFQPALVRRSRQLLLRLSGRQDVHLEQAVCTLLLGQTEEASHALELSHEYEPIAFIREHSQGSPDLLPGLCLYAERWLQDEVLPHFRDLSQKRVALKDYFADKHVQEYLEALPNEPETVSEWTAPVVMPTRSAARATGMGSAAAVAGSGFSGQSAMAIDDRRQSDDQEATQALIEAARARIATAGTVPSSTTSSMGSRATGSVVTMPAAERVPHSIATPPESVDSPANGRTRQRNEAKQAPAQTGRSRNGTGLYEAGTASRFGDSASEDRLRQRVANRPPKSEAGVRRFLLPAAVILGIIAIGFMVGILKAWQSSMKPASQELQVRLDQPLVDLPQVAAETPLERAEFTTETAQQAVQAWLAAKAAAMGPEHATDKLEQILTEPKLSEWKKNAEDAKLENWYKQYKHQVTIVSAEQSKDSPEQAKVVAEVSEATDYYEAGQVKNSTNDQNLRVQYNLVRKDSRWRIQSWNLL